MTSLYKLYCVEYEINVLLLSSLLLLLLIIAIYTIYYILFPIPLKVFAIHLGKCNSVLNVFVILLKVLCSSLMYKLVFWVITYAQWRSDSGQGVSRGAESGGAKSTVNLPIKWINIILKIRDRAVVSTWLHILVILQCIYY